MASAASDIFVGMRCFSICWWKARATEDRDVHGDARRERKRSRRTDARVKRHGPGSNPTTKPAPRSPAERAFARDAVPFGDKTRPLASLMFVPIKKDEKVIGLLSLQSYTPNAYTEKDLETFKALADIALGRWNESGPRAK